MPKHRGLDYYEYITTAHNVFGLKDLKPEKAKSVVRQEADQAHEKISAWFTERLQAAEFCICEIETTKPSPEFRRSLRDTHEKIKLHRDTVTSHFKEILTTPEPKDCYNKIICALQVLADVLAEFKPNLTPIRSPSDRRWSDRSTAGFRLRGLIQVPSKVNRAIDEALFHFEAIATALQLLKASLKLATALEEKSAVEARAVEEIYKQEQEQKAGNDTPRQGSPRNPPRDALHSPNSHKRPMQARLTSPFSLPDLFH